MNAEDYILEIICIIILFLCILIIWIFIKSSRKDFSKMKNIPIDGGRIILDKNGEIVINRPILYGIITHGCFFPTITFLTLLTQIFYRIPLGSLSNDYSNFALFVLSIVFVVIIIFGIIKIWKSRYKFGKIVINHNSQEVVYISSTRSEIPFSDIKGIRQEIFPYDKYSGFQRVAIIMKNKSNRNIELLSITSDGITALAKATYIEGLLKNRIGC